MLYCICYNDSLGRDGIIAQLETLEEAQAAFKSFTSLTNGWMREYDNIISIELIVKSEGDLRTLEVFEF